MNSINQYIEVDRKQSKSRAPPPVEFSIPIMAAHGLSLLPDDVVADILARLPPGRQAKQEMKDMDELRKILG